MSMYRRVRVGAWERFWESMIGLFKYIVAGYMMLAGAITCIEPTDTTVRGALHGIYGLRISLICAGIIIFAAGATLMWGKIKRNRKIIGRGLFSVYLCFFFAAILNAVAYGAVAMWLPNGIFALIMALLWLRWRFKTEYVNPAHFRAEVIAHRHER